MMINKDKWSRFVTYPNIEGNERIFHELEAGSNKELEKIWKEVWTKQEHDSYNDWSDRRSEWFKLEMSTKIQTEAPQPTMIFLHVSTGLKVQPVPIRLGLKYGLVRYYENPFYNKPL